MGDPSTDDTTVGPAFLSLVKRRDVKKLKAFVSKSMERQLLEQGGVADVSGRGERPGASIGTEPRKTRAGMIVSQCLTMKHLRELESFRLTSTFSSPSGNRLLPGTRPNPNEQPLSAPLRTARTTLKTMLSL